MVPLGCGRSLVYLGSYLADGRFQAKSSQTRAADLNVDFGTEPTAHPKDVPLSVRLHSHEYVVENHAPTASGTRRFKGQSVLATWRDDILTFVYGHEKQILSPHFLTTDSQGRAIISDPMASAIHVLDNKGGFRIPAGEQYRLHSAGAIAVDGEDNIYAADSDAGLIIVFDRYGHFLREIGRFSEDEGLFHDPAGLAIDRKNGLLYVSDSPRDTVFVLTLEGRVLRRLGGRRNESDVSLQHPESIVAKNDAIIVLDAGGSRIQMLDHDGKWLRSFSTGLLAGYVNELGLGADANGNIYLSNIDQSQFRVFDQYGRVLGAFGARGSRRGEFDNPAALWIDAANRVYISDEGNRRVQVFQIRDAESKIDRPAN
jgi:hypothetical protein